eukprot:1732271-Amphidinium_carterae.1
MYMFQDWCLVSLQLYCNRPVWNCTYIVLPSSFCSLSHRCGTDPLPKTHKPEFPAIRKCVPRGQEVCFVRIFWFCGLQVGAQGHGEGVMKRMTTI